MESKEIFAKIEEIYVSKNKEGKPTGRNFISHLIRSYFPIGKAERVLDVPTGVMKCAITGQKLFAIGEIWEAMQSDEFFKNMTKSMLIHLDPEAEKVESPLAKVTNGRVVAITGKDTTTYLSQEAYQSLYDWYATKILSGDQNISWIARNMMKKEVIKQVRERLPEAEDQKKIDRLEKLAKHPERQKTTMGDLSALQELQAKLKAQEEAKTDK